jgi:putative heme iron utilization protein
MYLSAVSTEPRHLTGLNVFLFAPFIYLDNISYATFMLYGFKYGVLVQTFSGIHQNQQITKDVETRLVINVHKRDMKNQEAIIAE